MRRPLALLAFGLVAACAAVVGVDELEIGECKGGGVCGLDGGGDDATSGGDATDDTARPDGGGGEAGPPCSGDAGPRAVRVGPPDNSFCIDSTEVTNKQYLAFVEAGVDAKSQGPECAWNTSFAPTSLGSDDYPVANVDWCDAIAYCKWAGKYLCGKAINGKRVGPVTQSDVGDYNTHQWLIACSAQKNRYPYGSLPDGSACNVGENDAGRTLPVGSKPGCEGSYPGVFDLVGNVWEWFDGPCRSDAGLEVDGGDGGPASNECWVKGGGYLNRGSNIDCRVDGLGSRRDTKVPFIGFRCCSD